MKTLLIAENNEDFCYVVQWHFEQTGMNVLTTTKGEHALLLYQEHNPDIVLLDINLDDNVSGKEVARNIRLIDKDTPIIFMSGESKSPVDVVEGFDIGCNFFLKKPVSIDEIEAHINSLINVTRKQSLYRWENCTFNSVERTIHYNSKKKVLSEKESNVLQILADYPGQTVLMNEILYKVWSNDSMEESLRNIVSSLRKKISGMSIQIETVKNKGYRLETIID